MSTTANKQFISWVLKFSGAKKYYPEPWKSAPETVFSSARTVVRAAAAGSTSATRDMVSLGTVRAVNALTSGQHTIAVHDSKVYVEYKSSSVENPDERRVAVYDYLEHAVSGCILPNGKVEEASILPITFSVDKAGSGVPFFLAIVLGLGLKALKEGDPDSEIFTIAKRLVMLSKVTPGEQLEGDNGIYFAELSSGLYHYLLDNKIGGVDSSFNILRLWEGALAEASSKAEPYAQAVRRIATSLALSGTELMSFVEPASKMSCVSASFPSNIFTFGGAAVEDVDFSSIEDEKPGTDFRALREELHLDIHTLTAEEKAMVPVMGPGYVVDKQLLEAARTIKADWKFPGLDLAPNIILEGDSGSGKTAATSFWACVFGMPRTKMTMNPMMESSNLIGAFYPVFSDVDDWSLDAVDTECLKKVQALLESSEILSESGAPKATDVIKALRRAFACDDVRDIIRESYGIPAPDEIEFDPDGSWATLGHEGPVPMSEEITMEATKAFESKSFRLMNILCEKAEAGQVSYRFILSELMKAFKFGWLVEIQEAASVLRPGVLTELNSLLEPNGRIELPNGSYISRHPDTIVVITTNRDYAGNADLNESLRDRCMFGLKMDLPTPAVMAERAMAQTGFTNRKVALEAANTIVAINNEAKNSNIKGSFGMRSLLAWMLDLRRGDYSVDAFMRRVIWKMTTRDDDVAILKAVFLAECPFVSDVRTGRRPHA